MLASQIVVYVYNGMDCEGSQYRSNFQISKTCSKMCYLFNKVCNLASRMTLKEFIFINIINSGLCSVSRLQVHFPFPFFNMRIKRIKPIHHCLLFSSSFVNLTFFLKIQYQWYTAFEIKVDPCISLAQLEGTPCDKFTATLIHCKWKCHSLLHSFAR